MVGSGSASYGQGWETDAIAACVVGGISFSGGIGKIQGIVVGVLIFTALTYSLTVLGVDTNLQFVFSGIIILAAGLFDMIDGRLARRGNLSTAFGALWDSTLDRYSELVTLFGICLLFLESGPEWFFMGVVTFTAMVGSVMVSYVRARAEGLGIECKVGLMQRPERVVVTAVAAIASGVADNLWWLAGGMMLIAVLANITAFWRIAHCYKVLGEKH
jgi:CDP-diacylglycerol--glycerol-3-phosphate 3-phosphatidyltransferase